MLPANVNEKSWWGNKSFDLLNCVIEHTPEHKYPHPLQWFNLTPPSSGFLTFSGHSAEATQSVLEDDSKEN